MLIAAASPRCPVCPTAAPRSRAGVQRVGTMHPFGCSRPGTHRERFIRIRQGRAQMARSSVTERVATFHPTLRASRCALAQRPEAQAARGVTTAAPQGSRRDERRRRRAGAVASRYDSLTRPGPSTRFLPPKYAYRFLTRRGATTPHTLAFILPLPSRRVGVEPHDDRPSLVQA